MINHPSRSNDNLLGKMWKTKSARYNAQARLRSKQSASIGAISLLSFYVVVASIVQLAFGDAIAPLTSKLISVGTLVVSVFIIVITLLENGKNYPSEADRMHQSALKIAELYNGFQALTVDEANRERRQFNDRYSSALNEIQVDHKQIDYVLFELRSADDLQLPIAKRIEL